MNQTPDELKQEGQTQPDNALSDSDLERVSGGAWNDPHDLIREFPEIEFGEP